MAIRRRVLSAMMSRDIESTCKKEVSIYVFNCKYTPGGNSVGSRSKPVRKGASLLTATGGFPTLRLPCFLRFQKAASTWQNLGLPFGWLESVQSVIF